MIKSHIARQSFGESLAKPGHIVFYNPYQFMIHVGKVQCAILLLLFLLIVRYWIWLRTSITAYKSLMVVQTVSTSSCYLAGLWNQTLDLHLQICTKHSVILNTRTFPRIEHSTRVMVICDLWSLRVYQTVHLSGRIMKQYTSITVVVFQMLSSSV